MKTCQSMIQGRKRKGLTSLGLKMIQMHNIKAIKVFLVIHSSNESLSRFSDYNAHALFKST